MPRKRKNIGRGKKESLGPPKESAPKASRADRRAEKKADQKAKKAFSRAIHKIVEEQKPVTLTEHWTWGWVTPEQLFISPVILNVGKFPVGIAIWTKEILVAAKVRAEHAISEKLPLVQGQVPHYYQIGQEPGELDPTVYGQSALHMFRQALSMCMGKIKDAAEDEFKTGMVFIDPPIMKIDDEILVKMAKLDKIRLISCVQDWDLEAITAWTPDS